MIIKNTAFRTRARAIDHLGREQIADCPTAVSELWKNSYDAYARSVELNVFDGELPVASLTDDGHGMSHDDLVNKWLVVGTDSKFTSRALSESDRNGLMTRERQGQKGIGRLSCANLGSLLLLISKRRNSPFAAALVDWRIFENPFLMLEDIQIPTIEFEQKSELFLNLPKMFDTLMANVWGTAGANAVERDLRITTAWEMLERAEHDLDNQSTKASIESTIISSNFEDRHLDVWDVWADRAESGTGMFMSNLSDDLIAQLSQDPRDMQSEPVRRAQERLFQTLSNFTDPFAKAEEEESLTCFSTAVIAWNGLLRRPIIDKDRSFSIQDLNDLEHIVDGYVDPKGDFHGRIKVFGEWQEQEIVIKSKSPQPSRSTGSCGPFHLRFGGFEKDFNKTSLTREKYEYFQSQSELYAGFMVHRDGLRVMPYGREDSDFFEIEKRRSSHAGRYFWSNRNIFGRVAIKRGQNPNLKDKAGREGLIDNTASKRFRSLVEGILTETAKRFFGTDADLRKKNIPEIKALRAQERAAADRKKLSLIQKKQFRKRLQANSQTIATFASSISRLKAELAHSDEIDESLLSEFKIRANALADSAKDYSLTPVPTSLGTLEDAYKSYRQTERTCISDLQNINENLNRVFNRLKPQSASEILRKQIRSGSGQLHARIRKMAVQGRSLLSNEENRFNSVVDERNRAYQEASSLLIEDLESGTLDLGTALEKLDEEYDLQLALIDETLLPLIHSLERLKDEIDVDNLLGQSMRESHRMREEINRLNALAQLGITVEIIGHELEALDLTISRGLRELPPDVKNTVAYRSILTAQNTLSEKWRFLSPLKLSGERLYSRISGREIYEYVAKFFAEQFSRNDVSFIASEQFQHFSVFDQLSRVLPIFINLVNNSLYWVIHGPATDRQIRIDFSEGDVSVADNGPGVDSDDVENLFSLFFTRKARGGRGVGLYLCRVNLAAGGHTIYYENDEKKKILPGANFKIHFKDASDA